MIPFPFFRHTRAVRHPLPSDTLHPRPGGPVRGLCFDTIAGRWRDRQELLAALSEPKSLVTADGILVAYGPWTDAQRERALALHRTLLAARQAGRPSPLPPQPVADAEEAA